MHSLEVQQWIARWKQAQHELLELERHEWQARKESLMCRRRLKDVITSERQREFSGLVKQWCEDSMVWALVVWKGEVEWARNTMLSEQLQAAQSSAHAMVRDVADSEVVCCTLCRCCCGVHVVGATDAVASAAMQRTDSLLQVWRRCEQWKVITTVASDATTQHELSVSRTEWQLQSIYDRWVATVDKVVGPQPSSMLASDAQSDAEFWSTSDAGSFMSQTNVTGDDFAYVEELHPALMSSMG